MQVAAQADAEFFHQRRGAGHVAGIDPVQGRGEQLIQAQVIALQQVH